MSAYELAADLHDILPEGESAAVYVGDSVLVLGPLATALVTWMRDGAVGDLDVLVDRAVERFGSPPGADPRALILAQMDDLCASGVVCRTEPREHQRPT